MTCDACDKAMKSPTADEFRVGCDECFARALAVTGAHQESKAVGKVTGSYKLALESKFGKKWEAGHKQVKRWSQRIKEANAQRLS